MFSLLPPWLFDRALVDLAVLHDDDEVLRRVGHQVEVLQLIAVHQYPHSLGELLMLTVEDAQITDEALCHRIWLGTQIPGYLSMLLALLPL